MAGTLYIVATPIGNLDDMPPRVAATFGAADFIAAEDTRVTMKLLNFLGLKKPMVSYYEHALQKGEGILRRIEAGENCALCSDAGMPCISDPGEQIVREAHERGIRVVPIPAASACVTALAASGHDLTRQLCISKKAHLILPTHRILDAAYEAAKGSAKIGTTGKGIGPTYTDKVSRTGMRVGDVLGPEFRAVYDRVKARHEATLRSLGYVYDIAELERQWFDAVEYLKEFRLIDSEYEINRLLAEGQPVLAEGAQGTLLDIDFGSYPFVTSSNTVCAGACTGLGIAPSRIGEVFGIFKAYCTRVGAGPFPTELFDETGARLRDLGHEYGAVTGRERRCGWLDMVALKYAIMIDGVTQLIMMKSDVMNDFDTIRVATAYEIGGERTDRFPYAVDAPIVPVYKEFKGWKCDLRKFRRYEDFPAEFKAYVEFIEWETGVPVRIISVGPDRDETIVR